MYCVLSRHRPLDCCVSNLFVVRQTDIFGMNDNKFIFDLHGRRTAIFCISTETRETRRINTSSDWCAIVGERHTSQVIKSDFVFSFFTFRDSIRTGVDGVQPEVNEGGNLYRLRTTPCASRMHRFDTRRGNEISFRGACAGSLCRRNFPVCPAPNSLINQLKRTRKGTRYSPARTRKCVGLFSFFPFEIDRMASGGG